MTEKRITDLRRADLAAIHILKAKAGLDDDCYRNLLAGLTCKSSAKDLDQKERWAVLKELRVLAGETPREPAGETPRRIGRPATTGQTMALVGKIEALLADAGRAWAYADGIAQRMFGKALGDCDADGLWRVVAALEYDRRRREREAV
jgi:phage gp16-like protein